MDWFERLTGFREANYSGPALARALAQPVIGYYALDLTEVGKGKPLEPVKVSMRADGKMSQRTPSRSSGTVIW
jgi:hypothetical protein